MSIKCHYAATTTTTTNNNNNNILLLQLLLLLVLLLLQEQQQLLQLLLSPPPLSLFVNECVCVRARERVRVICSVITDHSEILGILKDY